MPKARKKVIKPGSDLTADKADRLKAKLLQFIKKTPDELVIDCQKVKEIDPVGLSVIVAAYKTLQYKNAKLEMINIQKDIYAQLEGIGINQNIEICSAE